MKLLTCHLVCINLKLIKILWQSLKSIFNHWYSRLGSCHLGFFNHWGNYRSQSYLCHAVIINDYSVKNKWQRWNSVKTSQTHLNHSITFCMAEIDHCMKFREAVMADDLDPIFIMIKWYIDLTCVPKWLLLEVLTNQVFLPKIVTIGDQSLYY